MSGQFVLGVIIALLLLANWVTLYTRSDHVYLFKDGDMKIVSSQSKSALKFTGANALKAIPSNDAAQVTAAQFGMMDSYFDAAAGLCPSQRKKNMGAICVSARFIESGVERLSPRCRKSAALERRHKEHFRRAHSHRPRRRTLVTRCSGRLRQLSLLLRFA
jgi:hypothetical protein